MPGPVTVQDGALVTQDSSAVLVYVVDYDAENLATGVELAAVGTFTVTPATGLTQDNQALLSGNRKVRIRLATTSTYVGTTFRVEHVATTNESPTQTKVAAFQVQII